MNEPRELAPGIYPGQFLRWHDNHGLKLWHEWQAVSAQVPQIAQEWLYERDDEGAQYAGPSECLTRTVGNVALRVVLGGDGDYTPGAEMIERHGVPTTGPGRVKTSVCPPRSDTLFEALAAAEEAVGEVGQPLPLGRQAGASKTSVEPPDSGRGEPRTSGLGADRPRKALQGP